VGTNGGEGIKGKINKKKRKREEKKRGW